MLSINTNFQFDANDDLRITTQQARKHLGSTGLESHAHTIPNRDLSGEWAGSK